ncbi:MAG: hypothetical protein JNM94_16625 [Phycisphaerae bacterium]|nr:hypothetical protein [Phycisphaerae bacterium]
MSTNDQHDSVKPGDPRRERWSRLLAAAAGDAATERLPTTPPASAIQPLPGGREGGESRLWRAILGSAPVDAFGLDLDGDGPLWASTDWTAIEVWTEAELCGLHALARRAREVWSRPAPSAESVRVHARLARALRWHLANTQPDNATNRPWALHAFLLALPGDAEAELYAGTLLHNAQASGLPAGDPIVRWIVADAARELAGA